MKKILFPFLFLLALGLNLNGQNDSADQLDLEFQHSLEQFDKMLNDFDFSSITSLLMSPELMQAMPTDEELDLAKEQLRMGINQLQQLDLGVLENFLGEIENMAPELKELLPPLIDQETKPSKRDIKDF